MNFFGWLKPKPQEMQTVSLEEVRSTIFDGIVGNAPCHRANMPLIFAAMTSGAASYREWRERWDTLIPLMEENSSWLTTVDIPKDTKDFYGEIYRGMKHAIKKRGRNG